MTKAIWTDGGPEWLKIKVVASENPRISPEILEEARKSPNGLLWFAQEYCGEFVANDTQLFNLYDIKKATDDDLDPFKF